MKTKYSFKLLLISKHTYIIAMQFVCKIKEIHVQYKPDWYLYDHVGCSQI